ncbi:MAG: DEAD/DEAH box helicase [Acetobacteraceae bacterium]
MSSNNFASLGLAEPLLRALSQSGFTEPTPIQIKAIPPLLEGRDIVGVAQTGSGKTAAFALPMLQHLAANPAPQRPFTARALILAPTRELALQIEESVNTLGAGMRRRVVAILGGMSRSGQVRRMQSGADIVVGTPGRICDLMATRELRLDQVRHFVLDEGDRMLDLGFIKDIRRIVAALPVERQSSLFSATMPTEVRRLAEGMLRDPVRVEIAGTTTTVPRIEQHVHIVGSSAKRALLGSLLADPALSRVIVFTRTKHTANKVAEHLEAGGVNVDALHGNKSQPARNKALDRFRSGRARVLVATDIAARGIDVTGISHVINFDLPAQAEDYVHRIGRTARAGAAGIAISFCDPAERGTLRAIERMTGAPMNIASGGFTTGPREANDDTPRQAPRPQQRRRYRPGGHQGGMRPAA